MTNVRVRVFADLDKDGWINRDVPIGASPNIFPRSPYTTGTGLVGKQYTTQDDVYEDVQDISSQGFMKRLIQMGKTASEDYAENIHFGFTDYYNDYQRKLTDVENLVANSTTADYGSVFVPSSATNVDAGGKYGVLAKRFNIASEAPRFLIGLNYNTNSQNGLYAESGYIDGSNQYSKANNSVAYTSTPDNVNALQIRVGHNGTSQNQTVAQSFTITSGGYIKEVKFRLGPTTGTPTGGIAVIIYRNNVDKPDSSNPAVVSQTLLTPTQNALNTTTFTTQHYIAPGTYWIALTAGAQAFGNYYTVLASNVNSVTDGVFKWQGTSDFLNWSGGGGNYDGDMQVELVAPAITWSGFPITAGNTYTLSFYALSSQPSNNLKIRIYGNSATLTTPNYGRTYITGTDVTTPASVPYEVYYNVTFVAPVGVTQFAIDVQGSVVGSTITIGGLIYSLGSNTHPSDRAYDEQTAFGETQFAVLAEANKDYVLSFWARSTDGIDTLSGYTSTAEIGGSETHIEDSHSLTITSTWTRFNFSYPSRAFKRGIAFIWDTEKGGNPTGLDNVGTIEFKGFMLVEGTTFTPYQVGPIAAYDELSSYVLSFDTKSGKDNYNDVIAYEGTAEIVLNNNSKIFSPNNTASPLYGYLTQDIKVVIEVEDVVIWTGYTNTFNITPGLWEEWQVSINCHQGLYRFTNGHFSFEVLRDETIDEAVKQIVGKSGWRPPDTPYFATLNQNVLDENFVLPDPSETFDRIDEGVNRIEIIGLDWSRDTKPEKALKDLLESESAMLWLSRTGNLILVNRNYWINRTADRAINIDATQYLTNADYQYGENVVNRVQVQINRKRETETTNVWRTYRALRVAGRSNRTVDVSPRHTEGRARSVVEYTLEGATKEAYYSDPGVTYTNTNPVNSQDLEKIHLELFNDGGSRYTLRITNKSTGAMWVDVELQGKYLETGDEDVITIEDSEAIETAKVVYAETFSTNILSRDVEAQAMGAFYLSRGSRPDGEFTALDFKHNDAAIVSAWLDSEIGHIFEVTEAQTGETTKPHAVIAEEFSYNGGYLSVTYRLARAQQEKYFQLDTHVLSNPTANYIEDMFNIVPIAYPYATKVNKIKWPYEGMEHIIEWDFEGLLGGQLLLNPASDQYTQFNSVDLAGAWPELNAASASVEASRILIGRYVEAQIDAINDQYLGGSSFYQPYPAIMGYLKTSAASIDWRYTYAAQYSGVSKQGDTVFKALGRIPVWANTAYRAYARISNNTSLGTGSTNYGLRVHTDYDTLATGLATGTNTVAFPNHFVADFNSGSHRAVALSMFGVASASTPEYYVSHLAMLKRSNVYNSVTLDTTTTYKYSLFMKVDPQQKPHEFTLTVYGVDGTALGSQTQTVAYAPTKFEITIPTGANSKRVYAILTATEGVSIADILKKVYIYAHGITPSSVTSFTDLIVPATQYPLYI